MRQRTAGMMSSMLQRNHLPNCALGAILLTSCLATARLLHRNAEMWESFREPIMSCINEEKENCAQWAMQKWGPWSQTFPGPIFIQLCTSLSFTKGADDNIEKAVQEKETMGEQQPKGPCPYFHTWSHSNLIVVKSGLIVTHNICIE